MRELTEEEKDFIEERLSHKKDFFIAEDSHNNLIVKKVKVKSKSSLKERIAYYIAALFICLGFIISGLFLAYMARASNLLGDGVLSWLSKQTITPDMLLVAQQNGLGGIDKLIWLYNHEIIIVAAILTVSILLAGITLIVDTIVKTLQKTKEANEDE